MRRRDLCGIFDWSSQTSGNYPQERRHLQNKLAQVIQRLALTPEQIQALPDTSANAVAKRAYHAHFDPQQPETPYLPADLIQTDGSWGRIATRASEITFASSKPLR